MVVVVVATGAVAMTYVQQRVCVWGGGAHRAHIIHIYNVKHTPFSTMYSTRLCICQDLVFSKLQKDFLQCCLRHSVVLEIKKLLAPLHLAKDRGVGRGRDNKAGHAEMGFLYGGTRKHAGNLRTIVAHTFISLGNVSNILRCLYGGTREVKLPQSRLGGGIRRNIWRQWRRTIFVRKSPLVTCNRKRAKKTPQNRSCACNRRNIGGLKGAYMLLDFCHVVIWGLRVNLDCERDAAAKS